MRRSRLALAACMAAVLASGAVTATVTAGASLAATTTAMRPAGDGPAGFWWGTDSWPVKVTGSAPYSMPYLGGAYGGYIGMTGNWAYWLGCKGSFLAYSAANAAQARINYTKYHKGVGDGAYWFMGGPGVDPHYNGTAAKQASGVPARRPGRCRISRTATASTTRSSGRISSCPASSPPWTTAGTASTPRHAAAR